jgi:hypothetical protein
VPKNGLTQSQRTLRARHAALVRHSRGDGREAVAPAFEASPAKLSYWAERVDPNGELSPEERAKRAARAMRAHYVSLALRSARVRGAKSLPPNDQELPT